MKQPVRNMAKKEKGEELHLPTDADVDKYEMLEKLLDSIYNEMKEFSKKKPDEPLNKFKVTNVNRVLAQIKEIMKDEPTDEFLDLLDEDTLPSTSDSIIVIGQFRAAMEQYRAKYYKRVPGSGNRWHTKEFPRGQVE